MQRTKRRQRSHVWPLSSQLLSRRCLRKKRRFCVIRNLKWLYLHLDQTSTLSSSLIEAEVWAIRGVCSPLKMQWRFSCAACLQAVDFQFIALAQDSHGWNLRPVATIESSCTMRRVKSSAWFLLTKWQLTTEAQTFWPLWKRPKQCHHQFR